jgi:hypothetical protein
MEDLEERISSLRIDLKSYGKEIAEHIRSLYTNELPEKHIDLKAADGPQSVLKILRQEISDILVESKSRSDFQEKVILLL